MTEREGERESDNTKVLIKASKLKREEASKGFVKEAKGRWEFADELARTSREEFTMH